MPTDNDVLVQSERILIVDDTKSLHDDYRKILCRKSGETKGLDDLEANLFGESEDTSAARRTFELASAYQGQEALKLVEESLSEGRPFALAFVDMRMPPGWDGVETIENIWAVDPNLYMVVCSAYSDYSWDEIVDKLSQEDRLLILKKPFEHIEVQQIANALVSKWNIARRADMRMQQLEALVTQRTDKVNEQKELLAAQLEELARTRLQLVQAEKLASVGQLAAGVAHEINNPVGFITGNLGTMRNYARDLRRLTSQQRKCIDAIAANEPNSAAQMADTKSLQEEIDLDFVLEDIDALLDESIAGTHRVKKIVKDLFEFSHINSPDVVQTNINELLQKTVVMVTTELEDLCQIAFELGDNVQCWCDGGNMGQVFYNLIINAAHATESHGQITVRTGTSKERAWVEIQDTGAGIPEEQRAKIFDPFYSTKDVGKGTGLGLHIVQSVIDNHGGSISVESDVGVGTTFRIEIPLNENSAGSQSEIQVDEACAPA